VRSCGGCDEAKDDKDWFLGEAADLMFQYSSFKAGYDMDEVMVFLIGVIRNRY